MTTLLPLRDEQWDDLRRRFPADTYSTSFISMDGNYLPRSMVDALRAAGVWCEHALEPAEPTDVPLCGHPMPGRTDVTCSDSGGHPGRHNNGTISWTKRLRSEPEREPTLDDAMLGLSRLQDILTESASALGHLIPTVRHLVSIQEIRAAADVLDVADSPTYPLGGEA